MENNIAETPNEIIRSLRKKVLLHSHLYWALECPIVTDEFFDDLAGKLEAYQNAFPECCNLTYFDEAFKNFTAFDCFGLPFQSFTASTLAKNYLQTGRIK